FNNIKVAYPSDKSIVDLFVAQVKNSPDNIAIVFDKKVLSYIELDRLSNQLAHYILSNKDVNTGDLIGIMLERSDWLIISFLAILKTGCAYVPIDLNYPEERKKDIKKDSNYAVLIDNLLIDSFKENRTKYPDFLPKIIIKPTDLAYVIYTSGSTGKPKGVLIEHKSLVHLCFWHQNAYAIDEESKGTLFSGIGFDACVWEIYPYLLFGASLYPIDDIFRYDLDKLPQFLTDNNITHSYIPTSLCENFVDQEVHLPNTIILTGGDALRLNKSTDIVIYNNYGPTETTVVATNYKVSNILEDNIPIGKPIANTQVYIMDS
ncbi:AMP-binding protein, partial [Flavivirga jejuensis]|uniref:AMP-binding protein n=1 Tax=Flavivirga jejuensis TaxID=870487 RepID=UPI0031EFAE05